jgi:hypothetical protein
MMQRAFQEWCHSVLFWFSTYTEAMYDLENYPTMFFDDGLVTLPM